MIAIITENPRFYYEIVRELKKKRIEFLSLTFNEEIPGFVRVVITSKKEKGNIEFPNVVARANAKETVAEALRILRGQKKSYNELVIGIDPGIRPGLVVLGDKEVISIDRINSPEGILNAMKKIFAVFKSRKKMVKVGKGGGVYRNRIIKIIQENFKLPIQIVDETSTTKVISGPKESVKDIIAAINIALKEGIGIKSRVEIAPNAGEIKKIQEESRVVSKRVTISKKLAEKVLKGELTLEGAIKVQRKKEK